MPQLLVLYEICTFDPVEVSELNEDDNVIRNYIIIKKTVLTGDILGGKNNKKCRYILYYRSTELCWNQNIQSFCQNFLFERCCPKNPISQCQCRC